MNQIIAEKLALIAENEQKVYDKGKTDGTAEGYQSGYTEGYTAGYAEGEASGGGGSDFPANDFFSKTATEITMTGVTILGQYSIYQYSTLETVYLPDTTNISSNAIFNCSNLSNVVMSEGLITIGSSGNVFSACPNIKNLEIPSTVESIGRSAFTGLAGLETVTFLGTPKTIGTGGGTTVFSASLKTIYVPWVENDPTAPAGAPWGATGATIIYPEED